MNRLLRSSAKFVIPLVVLRCVGCAFSPGEPWGHVDATLDIQFLPPSDRIDESGALKTSLGYHVQLEPISLSVDGILLTFSGEGSATDVFDPANPPEGYNLCHNGHCHAETGELVSYEEIAQTLTGSDGGDSVFIPADSSAQVAVNKTAGVALPHCGSPCDTPRGKMTKITVNTSVLALSGRVFDGTGQSRLPHDGVAISVNIGLVPAVSTLAGVWFGKGHPVDRTAKITMNLGAGLFDSVDWGRFSILTDENQNSVFSLSEIEIEQIRTNIREKFAEQTNLVATID
ncbi:MAG: hypothetical protein HUU55_05880 [Myxococcales bacterium]|nr:hypothetical protein [Myxococcales bacterium]